MTEVDRKYDLISYINSKLVSQQINESDKFEIHAKDTISTIIDERNWLISALRSQGNAIITADTNGTVLLINHSAEKLIGWTEQEAVGRTLGEIFLLTNELFLETFEHNIQKILKERKVFEFTDHTVIMDKNRMPHAISGSASPIINELDHIVGIVISIQDITEKCKTEEEMIKRQSFESIGVPASEIAHDFNNTLIEILDNVSLAKIGSYTKDILERLTETEKALNKAKYLTQQLLGFSKSELPTKESTFEILQDSINFNNYLNVSSEKVINTKKETENNSTHIKRKILVLDDDILIRELIDTVLGNFGYEVIAVSDGIEVIENYKSAQNSDKPFNVVIMDLTIPGGMGARETINILTQLDPDVKAIVSSGYFNDPIINDFTKYGFKGAIAKPYGIKELKSILNSVIMSSE